MKITVGEGKAEVELEVLDEMITDVTLKNFSEKLPAHLLEGTEDTQILINDSKNPYFRLYTIQTPFMVTTSESEVYTHRAKLFHGPELVVKLKDAEGYQVGGLFGGMDFIERAGLSDGIWTFKKYLVVLANNGDTSSTGNILIGGKQIKKQLKQWGVPFKIKSGKIVLSPTKPKSVPPLPKLETEVRIRYQITTPTMMVEPLLNILDKIDVLVLEVFVTGAMPIKILEPVLKKARELDVVVFTITSATLGGRPPPGLYEVEDRAIKLGALPLQKTVVDRDKVIKGIVKIFEEEEVPIERTHKVLETFNDKRFNDEIFISRSRRYKGLLA